MSTPTPSSHPADATSPDRGAPSRQVTVDELRLGLHIELDLGWMSHPFARSQFRLDDAAQIDTLRRLGVREVRVRLDLSDPIVLAELSASALLTPAEPNPAQPEAAEDAAPAVPSATEQRRVLLAAQRRSQARSERLQAQASRAWLGVMREVVEQPQSAKTAVDALAASLVDELLGDEQTTLRTLNESAGTATSMHALNVTVLSLMLGRRLGLGEADLQAVAQGALLHDIGRQALPGHLRHIDANNTALRQRERHEHVVQGVRLGMAMGLDAGALRVIAQHHERHDGSGLPRGLARHDIGLPARVVALTDTFDRLCNPHPGEPLRTPHEAQALLFAQMRKQLDPLVLATFVQLIGVYPPGSLVQLSDERIALVVSVLPGRALQPSVVVHDPRVPRDDALLLHLHEVNGLTIRRSLHPQQLPRSAIEYLSPRERLCFYFAHELEVSSPEHLAA